MKYRYLALGDSYTIGEQVTLHHSFPWQLVKKLREKGVIFADPVIIAITGWTTDELSAAIDLQSPPSNFDLVTLLIGVNNQYRGRSLQNYRKEFEQLLQKGIHLAADQPNHVFVLSIPDWGVTPFAQGKDRKKIADEIDRFNTACQEIALAHHCHFIDITASTRKNGNNADFLAPDLLHPSAKEYTAWVEKLYPLLLLPKP